MTRTVSKKRQAAWLKKTIALMRGTHADLLCPDTRAMFIKAAMLKDGISQAAAEREVQQFQTSAKRVLDEFEARLSFLEHPN